MTCPAFTPHAIHVTNATARSRSGNRRQRRSEQRHLDRREHDDVEENQQDDRVYRAQGLRSRYPQARPGRSGQADASPRRGQPAGPPIPGSGSRPGGWASRRGAHPAWPGAGIPRSTDGSAGPLAAIAVGLVMAARMASGMSWTGTDVAGLGSRARHRRPVTRLASRTPADQPEHLSVDVLKYRALEAPPVAT